MGLPLRLILPAIGALALLTIVYTYGFTNGRDNERERWEEAQDEQRAHVEQLQAEIDAEEELAAVRERAMNEALLSAQTQARRISDELAQQIDATPTVIERRIEVPANCPAVVCPIVDVARDYRLFNCAIAGTSSCADVSDSRTAGAGDVALPRAAAVPAQHPVD